MTESAFGHFLLFVDQLYFVYARERKEQNMNPINRAVESTRIKPLTNAEYERLHYLGACSPCAMRDEDKRLLELGLAEECVEDAYFDEAGNLIRVVMLSELQIKHGYVHERNGAGQTYNTGSLAWDYIDVDGKVRRPVQESVERQKARW